MLLALRLEPRPVQVPRLELKLHHTCAVCRIGLPTAYQRLDAVLDVLLGIETLESPYQLCRCGRIHSPSVARDRNYRARWRRRAA